jgi:hypothetical protein
VSVSPKRWAQLAQELQFSQLDIARKQADTWRTGLATLTTLLTAILVVKGRSDASTLTTPFQILVAVLLALALLLLLTATMWLTRALAGRAGDEILLTGETLKQWTDVEVGKVSTVLRWVPWMAAASVVAVAAAVGVTWFAPTATTTKAPFVQVSETDGQTTCGTFIGETQHQLILTPNPAPATPAPAAPAPAPATPATPASPAAATPATPVPATPASSRTSLTIYLPLTSVLTVTPVTTCS